MNCKNCNYAKNEFEKYMNWYDKQLEEENTPGNPYISQCYEDMAEQSCYCEKIGGRLYKTWVCPDAYDEASIEREQSRHKKRTKRRRDICHKRKIRKMANDFYGLYNAHAIPISKDGRRDKKNPRYYRRLEKTRCKKNKDTYYKRLQNKRVRHTKIKLKSGNMYKRIH